MNNQEMIHYLENGSRLRRLGEWDQAIHQLTAAINLFPRNFVGYVERALAFNGRGNELGDRRYFQAAVNDLDIAIEIGWDDPNTLAEAHYNRGCIRTDDLGQHDLAIVDFNQARRLDPAHIGIEQGLKRALDRLRDDPR